METKLNKLQLEEFVGYERVSTQEQGKSGLGLESQDQMIRNTAKNGNLIAVFIEIESGNKTNRIELQKAIALCKQRGATLVVAKLDRLSRNVHFISTLMESKVKFICSDFPTMDSFTIHLFSAMAQREREMISERTSKALQVIKARIEDDGYYITKAGKVIYSLGSELMQDKAKAKEAMAAAASNRVYQPKSAIGIELIKSYAKNGIEAKEIKQKLEANGINLSLKTIYEYKKAI